MPDLAPTTGPSRSSGNWLPPLLLVAGILATLILLDTRAPLVPGNIHDDQCQALAADTFLHGRLANPPHPLWWFFDAPHTLQQPTYASKYPPGPALMLALGKLLGGRYIVGAWIGNALAGLALYWMSLALVGQRWAVVAGLMALVTPAGYYYANEYTGGTVAAAGAALVLGAALRVGGELRRAHGVLLGAGLALLMLSRQYEGLCFSVISLGLACWLLGRRPRPWQTWRGMLVVPAAMVMLPALLWMGYYNWRVTGSATTLPYQLHMRQYMIAPLFIWGTPRGTVPQYTSELLREFHTGWEMRNYVTLGTPGAWWAAVQWRLGWIRWLFVPNWGVPLLAMGLLWTQRSNRVLWFALLLTGGFLAAIMAEAFNPAPHYAAPLLPVSTLLLLLIIRGAARVRITRRLSAAPVVGSALLVALALNPFLSRASDAIAKPHPRGVTPREWLVNLLLKEGRPGDRYLVFVRHTSAEAIHEDWVYNGAEIGESPVVFARDCGEQANRKLAAYFPDRRLTLVLIDSTDVRLFTMPPSGGEPLVSFRWKR